jgi:hypothetical protein
MISLLTSGDGRHLRDLQDCVGAEFAGLIPPCPAETLGDSNHIDCHDIAHLAYQVNPGQGWQERRRSLPMPPIRLRTSRISSAETLLSGMAPVAVLSHLVHTPRSCAATPLRPPPAGGAGENTPATRF